MLNLNEPLMIAYYLKEDLREIWNQTNKDDAELVLNEWGPRTPDAENYRRLLTRVANHLLPIAHPPSDLCHTINSRRDARSSINASCDRWHESEIRRLEEYDRDHGVLA